MRKITLKKSRLSLLSSLFILFIMLAGNLNAQNKPAREANTSKDGTQKIFKHNNLNKLSEIYDQRQGGDQEVEDEGDDARLRNAFELEMLKDPATGKIPDKIREKELKYMERMQKSAAYKSAVSRNSARLTAAGTWTARGPYNVGGRTRALAFDRDNENIMLAGGVSGGMWRSENGGASWQKATGSNEIQSVTAIVQDPRPGSGNIWYYSTGERIGNSASGGGAFFAGNGIYKSTDGGRSWAILPSTADNSPQLFSQFDLIFNLAVHPVSGDLYAATWTGIYRSQNGGASFSQVLVATQDTYTNIMITPGGTIYAAFESYSAINTGISRSTNGTVWANITPIGFPVSYGRMALGYTPTNENAVYVFADANGTRGYLWKHYADPANLSSPTGGGWVNLTTNIPNASIGGSVGNLNTQGGYNLVVKVHPLDSNFVIIGGTNLYRSLNGFKSPVSRSSWIGGYSPINDVSLYTNQHPDQHELLFSPSNPDKVVSGNDGGLFVTNNIRATNAGNEPVTWASLNNGYLTTQPYAVSVEPTGTGDELIAGFQDNGTWFTASANPATPWSFPFGGDGCYNAIADSGITRYVSSQGGNIYRLNYASASDAGDDYISFSRITPAGAGGFAFVNPFILDPNNDNVMYLPAGDRIWRNDNLDGIPIFSNALATANWVNLNNSAVPTTAGSVTAVAVSRLSPSNRLYYGTSRGGIYKIDNANLNDQPAVDIATGKGLPAGFVSCITVDPANANRVFAVFSNYSVISIFYSGDAGITWANISGNLEQNANGSGTGPSVRWLAIEGNSDRYYAGTSTGLYATSTLNGNATVWTQESADLIGNVVVPMIKTRDDGFAAAASHGNGLYSARFSVTPLPKATLFVNAPVDNFEVFENSPNTILDISDVFKTTNGATFTTSIINDNPSLVSASINGNLLTLSYTSGAFGAANIGLIATSGNESVSEGFTVSVKKLEFSLYTQLRNFNGGNRPSQLFTDFDNALAQLADDFIVPEGQTWNIEKVYAAGAASGTPVFDNLRVIVYADDAGKPGAEIYNSGVLIPTSGIVNPNFELILPAALNLAGGKYWLSVYPEADFFGGGQWFWSLQEPATNSGAYFRDADDLFGTGATDWTPAGIAFEDPNIYDLSFALFGSGTNIPPPAAPDSLDASYVSNVKFKVTWKDNANNEIGYLIQRSTDGVNFARRATTGSNTTSYFDTDNFDPLLTYYYRVAAIGVSDTSAYSNVDSVAIIPAAPVAIPATRVFSKSFTANWNAVPGAMYYLLDVSSDDFQTFAAGYQSKVVYGTSQVVSGLDKRLNYKYRVRAANAGGISGYSNVIIAASVRDLRLVALCSDDPFAERRWKVTNPNPFAVEVTWKILGTSQTGTYMADPGNSYFTSNAFSIWRYYPTPNIALLFWKDDFGYTQLTAAISSGSKCAGGTAPYEERGSELENVNTDLNIISSVWPNPTTDKFKLFVASATANDRYSVEVFNIQGQRVFAKQQIPANTIQEIDASKFAKGIYMVKVNQGNNQKVVKLVKQ